MFSLHKSDFKISHRSNIISSLGWARGQAAASSQELLMPSLRNVNTWPQKGYVNLTLGISFNLKLFSISIRKTFNYDHSDRERRFEKGAGITFT
jgi:hypothetical protein